MLESDAIIKYLYDTYGDGKVQMHSPAAALRFVVNTISSLHFVR